MLQFINGVFSSNFLEFLFLGTMINKLKSFMIINLVLITQSFCFMIYGVTYFYLLYPDSSLSFPWVNSRSSKSQEAIPETESTQHSHKAVNSKLDVSHEILAPMIEGFTSEDSTGDKEYVGSGVCHKWNTSLPESKSTEENCEKDNYNEMQDSRQELASYSEERTSHTLLASHDGTPVLCIDVPALNVENEESQHQDDELFETLYTSAKPQPSEAVRCVTSNQQSVTHPGSITQEAAQYPLSNPLWTGDSKLNMAPPQCSDEEIHSSQEWEESGKYSDANESTIIFICPC